ncbi:uncharacterized protein LOC111717626 [Eurytemora carolleeae]|uniref:uncharacterized protein LOC111717626 n=1 Tax=Eurytemora carolleeae TaxID=1294199 RepID=UPI000C78AEA1|nr:uncharacterized protein LOC111717626 [Eurytemora carolleeae]|eukprot:XP_023348893.1 uncharacterized protein LOC111717626 [Eurytemora affinis]
MEQRPKRNYICLGGWETVIPAHQLIHTKFRNTYQQYSTLEESSLFVEDDDISELGNITLGYVVATQDQVPEKRICFMYTKHNDEYSWTVDQTACLRNIRPGIDGRRRFNTTKLETCGATYLTFQTWSALCILISIYLLYL